jgi:serine/threonine protein kinase
MQWTGESGGRGSKGARLPCALCGQLHLDSHPCPPNRPRASGGTLAVTTKPPISPLTRLSDDELIGAAVGNFRIVRMLGRGGMGTVYLGEHAIIGSKVAIKFLHAHLASDPTLVERFFAEAKAANLVGHEHIVSIFDLNLRPPNHYYLVMEYLEGRPLSALVGKPLEPAAAVSILMQACDALAAAHAAGVIHRDLKPENLFLTRRGAQDDFVKMVDFGIAKLTEATQGITSAGLVVGTPEYMAPEQWTGLAVDGRTDLYALGVIAYALATGQLPFRESSPLNYYLAHRDKAPAPPRQLNPAWPAELERVILKTLSKRPEARYASALEMKRALEAALSSSQVPASAFDTRSKPMPLPRLPTPQPEEHPHAASLPAVVRWAGQRAPLRGVTYDLSRGGVFVGAEPPLPPLFTPVYVALEHPDQLLECEGEVVRHVTVQQAQAWRMSPGFAIQFRGLTPALRSAMDRIIQGLPLVEVAKPAAPADDNLGAALLDYYRRRISGDYYGLLGAAQDAECSELRSRLRQALLEVEQVSARDLLPQQRAQIQPIRERLQAAQSALGTPASRAQYDASRGNFRGVARCLAAGLSIAQLADLRRRFLADRPRNETAASLEMVRANALAANGEPNGALKALESALVHDPLSLELHQKYWSFKRQLTRRAPAGGGSR